MKEEISYDEVDVLIIGAGASGIAGLRQLKLTTNFKIRCLEQRSKLGGVWNFEPNPGEMKLSFTPEGQPIILDSSKPFITPIYDGLRTNVPVKLMLFKDKPFNPTSSSTSSFPYHHEILNYLNDSIEEEFMEFIQFNSQVNRIRYKPNHLSLISKRWMIEYTQTNQPSSSDNDNDHRILFADFILTANGHNSKPYIPFIEGLSTFSNRISHSFYYRKPNENLIKSSNSIAVVGLGPSGYDILREISTLSKPERPSRIYSLSNHSCTIGYDFNDPNSPSWTKSIIQKPGLKSIKDSNTLVLNDLTELDQIDLILFATGYQFDFRFCWITDDPWNRFPILNSNSNQKRCHHLDSLQTFYFPDPTFAFLVINSSVIPFPLAEHQARAIAARWSKKSSFELFPSTNETDESNSIHILIPPEEYNLENHLLNLIGEGGDENENQEFKNHDGWKNVEDWKIQLRLNGHELRKLELGY